MNPEHPHFAEWDAAYVLGALSAADRHAFEAHLADCAECRRSVTELAPTAGLLSRISAERAATIGTDPAPEDGIGGPEPRMRADVVSLARRRARRRRAWGLAAAAAVVLVIAAVVIPLALPATTPSPAVAMSSVEDVPLEATLHLSDVDWGTRIELDCRYTESPADAPAEGWSYALAVVGPDGDSATLSTWRALPGASARLSAGTALSLSDVRAVEIVSVRTGTVLMRYEPAQ